jgi:hypothetical protein
MQYKSRVWHSVLDGDIKDVEHSGSIAAFTRCAVASVVSFT